MATPPDPRARSAPKPAAATDAPLSSYLKWSALMVAIVTIVGLVAARVIHALGLDG
jgi:hypothetical protein